MKGFINIIKPEKMSSAYAVSIVKKRLKLPCGHMGTLDPMASGVLPIGIHKSSRLFDYLLDKTKTYIAEFEFGYITDTLDVTGSVIERTKILPTKEQITSVLDTFVGEIDQIPPKYSAKCIDGKRGYQLARQGVDFTLQPKKVNVLSLKMLEQTGENKYLFEIKCKGGTYIRSLARDIGYAVNSLAVMTKLLRSKSGFFTLENGVTIEQFMQTEDIESLLIPADSVIDFPIIKLTDKQAFKVGNGVYEDLGYKDGLYRVYHKGEFWGVGKSEQGLLRIKAYVK